MSTIDEIGSQPSVAGTDNFLDRTAESLEFPWVQDLLGSDQAAQLHVAVKGIGVLALTASPGTGMMETVVARHTQVNNVYALGVPELVDAMDWSITLPGGSSEGHNGTSVSLTSADIRRPSGSQLSSRYIETEDPSTGLIAVYMDSGVKNGTVLELANSMHDLTRAADSYLYPTDQDKDLARAEAVLTAVHNEFVILDSDHGFPDKLSERVAGFVAQGDSFDEKKMVAELEEEFPAWETVRRAITAVTLAQIYGGSPAQEGDLPQVTNELVAAYQEHGYLPLDTPNAPVKSVAVEAQLEAPGSERSIYGRLLQRAEGIDPLRVVLGAVGVSSVAALVGIETSGYGPVQLAKDVMQALS